MASTTAETASTTLRSVATTAGLIARPSSVVVRTRMPAPSAAHAMPRGTNAATNGQRAAPGDAGRTSPTNSSTLTTPNAHGTDDTASPVQASTVNAASPEVKP